MLAVNSDNDSRERIEPFIRDKKLAQPILMNGNGVATRLYHARSFPTMYWIDRSGKIVARETGFRSEKEMEGRLQRLLRSRS